ncbi:MAG: tripartite tricarboxylate transporter permease [Candidatus Pacearchaeota archaeon]|nr:tripartite tricarboxylate transporter permease [Candidatus Pacearchaeota archaeon]
MLEQIFLAILAGIIAGTITGLFPGIHINLVALLLFVSSNFFLQFASPVVLAIFIIAMSITHTFLDFIPSVFLGAPNEDTALSVLPGHLLLLKGYGYAAIKLTTIGSFFGLLVALALSPLLTILAPLAYSFLVKIMAFLLIAIVSFLILSEKKKFWAFFIFFISGILGLATLNFSLINQPLLPLFSGLFGTSLLAISFFKDVRLPEQKIKTIKIEKREISSTLTLSIFASLLVSFLPGVGSAQAATIASAFKKLNEKTFLLMLGAVNSLVIVFSFVALYAIDKPRSGVAVFVGKFLPFLNQQQLWLLLLAALLAGCISVFLALFFARTFSKSIMKINYKWLCFYIILFIALISIAISGPLSLLVLIAGTSIGVITSIIGIKKIHMMGSLLLPVILYYLL